MADVATLTAIANDYGYHRVFSRQLEMCGQPGDLLVVLSGSGGSANILNAIDVAKAKGISTWAVVGGGKAAELADYTLITGGNMHDCEQEQLKIGHTVADLLKTRLTLV